VIVVTLSPSCTPPFAAVACRAAVDGALVESGEGRCRPPARRHLPPDSRRDVLPPHGVLPLRHFTCAGYWERPYVEDCSYSHLCLSSPAFHDASATSSAQPSLPFLALSPSSQVSAGALVFQCFGLAPTTSAPSPLLAVSTRPSFDYSSARFTAKLVLHASLRRTSCPRTCSFLAASSALRMKARLVEAYTLGHA
jgi:hypothetical protein